MAKIHRLDAGADTVHWGYFDAKLPPVLTVDSGDTVTISTVSGAREMMPPPPLVVPDALAEVQARVTPKLPGHICTGPVAVRGAKPGQVLEVHIKSIELGYGWGYNHSGPLTGALPDDFPQRRIMHITLDRRRMTGRLPLGPRNPPAAVLWRHGGGPTRCLGQRLDAAAAPQWWQSRQQGAGGGNHSLFAGPR
jgi:acetamidase/formamidase